MTQHGHSETRDPDGNWAVGPKSSFGWHHLAEARTCMEQFHICDLALW